MRNSVERVLQSASTAPFYFGQLLVQKTTGHFVLSHRDEDVADQMETFHDAEDAIELAKYDDAGNYRPLKTAPNLRHGWRLEFNTLEAVARALDYFYPARLAAFAAWKTGRLQTTPLRETLNRQSGMYRVAAKISGAQLDSVVTNFCRSDGGCLRTILWKRDAQGTVASTELPNEKFDPAMDQAALAKQVGTSRCDVQTAQRAAPTINEIPATVPLLCQEACNLLIAECRRVIKGE